MMGGRCSATRQSSAEEQRRLGFVFLSGEEAADALRNVGIFYLWEAALSGRQGSSGWTPAPLGKNELKVGSRAAGLLPSKTSAPLPARSFR
jgi:hypothetical protein